MSHQQWRDPGVSTVFLVVLAVVFALLTGFCSIAVAVWWHPVFFTVVFGVTSVTVLTFMIVKKVFSG